MNKYIVTVVKDTTKDYYGSHEYFGTYFVKADNEKEAVEKIAYLKDLFEEENKVVESDDYDFLLETGFITVWSFEVRVYDGMTWHE